LSASVLLYCISELRKGRTKIIKNLNEIKDLNTYSYCICDWIK
jgi:hypothetical protein